MSLSQQVIEVGHQLLDRGLVQGTAGNVSARCDDGMHFLITPTACDYRILRRTDLVRISLATGEAGGRWSPSSEWRLHLAIYRARLDAHAVIHHHSTMASAVAVTRKTIPIFLDEAVDIGPISTASYAPSGSQELAEAASRELTSGSNAVLLANHGVVVLGRDLREAFRRALEVERLASVFIAAEALGGAYPLSERDVARNREYLEVYRASAAEHLGRQRAEARLPARVTLGSLVSLCLRAGFAFAAQAQSLISQRFYR
jgi:L-fuculose-phosphate aldolase